jgi:hypothetical protein
VRKLLKRGERVAALERNLFAAQSSYNFVCGRRQWRTPRDCYESVPEFAGGVYELSDSYGVDAKKTCTQLKTMPIIMAVRVAEKHHAQQAEALGLRALADSCCRDLSPANVQTPEHTLKWDFKMLTLCSRSESRKTAESGVGQ